MKSVAFRIAVWSVLVLALAFGAFLLISRIASALPEKNSPDVAPALHHIAFHQAIQVYESSGAAALSRFLQDLNQPHGLQFYLTDLKGRDLATGVDRSAMVTATLGRHQGSEVLEKRMGGFVAVTASDDHKYLWLVVGEDRPVRYLWPFFLLVCASVVIMSWVFTWKVALPLHDLAGVVDRFGQGDLGARSDFYRADELGRLSRSFNAMAARIEDLFLAEKRLLQDVSHELRSPLARLSFEAELVRQTKDRDATAVRLRREIQRLSELVCDLIDMSRAEGERNTVPFDEVSLSELLVNLAESCDIETIQKKCEIQLNLIEPVIISGNAELLRRAFENLIRNAIRYTPLGTSVEVSLASIQDHIEVCVRDYGIGIPEHLAEKVFDPFFRIDSSRAENSGGIGLGLAIARRAIRLHQGDIKVGNAYPGTLMKVTLPAPPTDLLKK
jgi:two-component system sensor histidine kinase CpxA